MPCTRTHNCIDTFQTVFIWGLEFPWALTMFTHCTRWHERDLRGNGDGLPQRKREMESKGDGARVWNKCRLPAHNASHPTQISWNKILGMAFGCVCSCEQMFKWYHSTFCYTLNSSRIMITVRMLTEFPAAQCRPARNHFECIKT